MVRKLKFHEQKLLKKVDFISWELDNNLHELKIMKKYMIQKREHYTLYNKLSREIRTVAEKIKTLEPKDPFRNERGAQLLEKLYMMGLITTKRNFELCSKITASCFCRRRLPVIMVRSKMVQTLKAATTYIEQGHVRVGPQLIKDPAFLVSRPLEDFVTWVDNSAIKKRVLEYNDLRDDFEIIDNFIRDPGEKSTNALILFSSGFGPYQPNNIIFPQHSGRKFRPEWYSSFPWIEYSPSSNSAFCFYCRAFPSNTSDPTFVSVGFKQWSKASYKSFPQHEKSFGHKEAIAKLAGYKSSKKSGSIISKVNTHHQQIVADNRAYLKCILDSLLYCARQSIAVRGHREDEDSSNKGNFLELLTLRANDNDIIQRYFIEKEKTFRYVSGDYTNTFLEYLPNIVIKNIIDNVIATGIFSIIVDETQDLSRHEQVAIIIRYATKDLSPAEVFLGFYKTETTDGETLSMLIKSTLVSHGLKIENIRGQCYDGAASMRGSYRSIRNLAKQVSYVRNVFGTLNTLHNFIGASSKRHAIFEKMYSVLNVSTCDGPKTLKSLSDTRWSCRLDALKAVLLNFQTVVSTLEDISENDAVYGSDANALLNNVQSMAKETIQELCNMRCEESFNNTWNDVDILRKQYNVSSPILPRKQKIPAKLGGGLKEVENTTINKHYKINIYFAVLDNIINDMGERFEENNLYVLNCMQDILLNDMPNNNSFKEINKMYGFDEYNLKAETTILNRMYKTVHDQNNVQSKINFIASENYKAGFPTLTRLIQLFITIPTNSASCERSFSCLRRLKTYLRTTMGQSRLNSLGILQIERERSSLIDKFSAAAECRGRRLLLQ
ncbi:hypothetical protein QTP88_002559 [Uroleucon formosanum]